MSRSSRSSVRGGSHLPGERVQEAKRPVSPDAAQGHQEGVRELPGVHAPPRAKDGSGHKLWAQKGKPAKVAKGPIRLRICSNCELPTDLRLGVLYSTDTNCTRCGNVVGLGSIVETPRPRPEKKPNGGPTNEEKEAIKE